MEGRKEKGGRGRKREYLMGGRGEKKSVDGRGREFHCQSGTMPGTDQGTNVQLLYISQ